MGSSPSNEAPYRLIDCVSFGADVVVHAFANLYGCRIGDNSRIGTYVEVQRGVSIGSNCKIQSHTVICEGVVIDDAVFIGHGVTFVNDKRPRATTSDDQLQTDADWELLESRVARGASVGSGSLILGGVHIGEEAMVGAGSVVTIDVAAGATVVGNPARTIGEGARLRTLGESERPACR